MKPRVVLPAYLTSRSTQHATPLHIYTIAAIVHTMKLVIGVLVFTVATLAAVVPPIDPNNPLTNPAINHDLLIVNPGLISPGGTLTPEQALTIQNQLIAQKNLEALAAQLAAQAGVPPPAGIIAPGAPPVAAPAPPATPAAPPPSTPAAPAAAPPSAPAAPAAAPPPAAAAVAIPMTQGAAPIFQVPSFAALSGPPAKRGGGRQSLRRVSGPNEIIY
ncbi:hypothetical protein GQ54DRAFT_323145 [Martensiomyces pterosporus]|nr:hypothetical protein GQ54DRAFT_323145 [Martensiomyces pterosporus]